MALSYLPTRAGVGVIVLCLSGDTKPASGATYEYLIETDTGKTFFWNGAAWTASLVGTGTVTSVSVTTANGVSGSVANPTTTPAITLTLGAITPTSVNSVVISGASSPTLAVTGTTTVSGSNTGDQTAANPTATASDVAVNGSASTYMRSDAAPAVQKTSASVFGLCKVDGSTITASGGVISAVAGLSPGEVFLASASPTGTNVVTFNNISTLIPAGFTPKALEVRVAAKSTAAATLFGIEIQIRFNNDSTAIYDFAGTQQIGNVAPANGSAVARTQIPFGYAADNGANTIGGGKIEILNYLDTTAHKPCLTHATLFNGTATSTILSQYGGGTWRSNAAIDRIDVLVSSGNYSAPTLVTLVAKV